MNEKTPYYVIDKEELDNNIDQLKKALEETWNNYIIAYSYKTNSLPWIIKYINSKHCFAEVVSNDELELAKQVGVKASNIIYNGPIKTKDSFIEMLQSNAIVNIDSQREIEWLDCVNNKNCKIGIRVNFDIEKMCPGQSQCPDDGGRFGFCYENGELFNAIQRINNKGFSVTGLHLHTSSSTRGIDIYNAIAKTACDIKNKYDLHLSFLDIGGGFYGGLANKPQYKDYLIQVSRLLQTEFNVDDTKLVIEPGMALIGSPVSYVTSVIDIKDTEFNRFVITDGTRTSIDPLMRKTSYFRSYKYQYSRDLKHKQIICGYTCMEHDRLYEAIEEPELCVGDVIVYEKVGAYTMCLTPLFIKYFPDVYVREKDKVFRVRRNWGVEEYLQKSEIE